MRESKVKELRIDQKIDIQLGNSVTKGVICVIDTPRRRIGVYDDLYNYFEFPYRQIIY